MVVTRAFIVSDDWKTVTFNWEKGLKSEELGLHLGVRWEQFVVEFMPMSRAGYIQQAAMEAAGLKLEQLNVVMLKISCF